MLQNLRKKQSKKGFTLIELVIVLAVLAIIAMIAIPNFTRVRNEALIDGDIRAAESIEKITLMGIANGDILSTVTTFNVADGGIPTVRTIDEAAGFRDLFRDANGPQVPESGDVFVVTINSETGAVSVGYTEEVTFAEQTLGPVLAGADIES